MNSDFPSHSILAAGANQVSADLSDEHVVILDLTGGTYYELSGVGARVWSLVQRESSFQSILDTLLDEYSVEPEQCEADLRALVGDMAARGLVRIHDAPS
jgi:hypothetical protein